MCFISQIAGVLYLLCCAFPPKLQVILFEIDCATFYTNLHELFCHFTSWTNRVNLRTIAEYHVKLWPIWKKFTMISWLLTCKALILADKRYLLAEVWTAEDQSKSSWKTFRTFILKEANKEFALWCYLKIYIPSLSFHFSSF